MLLPLSPSAGKDQALPLWSRCQRCPKAGSPGPVPTKPRVAGGLRAGPDLLHVRRAHEVRHVCPCGAWLCILHGVVVPLLHWLEVQAHAGSAVRHAGDTGKAFSTTIFSWGELGAGSTGSGLQREEGKHLYTSRCWDLGSLAFPAPHKEPITAP